MEERLPDNLLPFLSFFYTPYNLFFSNIRSHQKIVPSCIFTYFTYLQSAYSIAWVATYIPGECCTNCVETIFFLV